MFFDFDGTDIRICGLQFFRDLVRAERKKKRTLPFLHRSEQLLVRIRSLVRHVHGSRNDEKTEQNCSDDQENNTEKKQSVSEYSFFARRFSVHSALRYGKFFVKVLFRHFFLLFHRHPLSSHVCYAFIQSSKNSISAPRSRRSLSICS